MPTPVSPAASSPSPPGSGKVVARAAIGPARGVRRPAAERHGRMIDGADLGKPGMA